MGKITSLSFFFKKTRAVRVWFKKEITIFSVFESDDTPIHYKFKVFRKYETRIPGVSFFVAYFASPFQHGRRRLNFIKNAWFRRRGMLLQFELSWFLLPYVCKKLQCWQLIFCFQANIAVLKKQVFSAHTRHVCFYAVSNIRADQSLIFVSTGPPWRGELIKNVFEICTQVVSRENHRKLVFGLSQLLIEILPYFQNQRGS